MCRRDFNYALHLHHYNLFSMSPRFAVSLVIEIGATAATISFRRVRLYVRTKRAVRRNVDYRNVCFPIERLSEPNDAFRTRVRAHTYNVWTVRAIAGGLGRSHCVPLILRCTLDKLANNRHLHAKCTSSPRLHQEALCINML